MQNFAQQLRSCDIVVDAVCINQLAVDRCSTITWPLYIQKCFNYCSNSTNPVAKLLKRFFLKFFISRLVSCYDLVDFHAYYPIYNDLMRKCVEKGTKFDITLWGSDLMRADDDRKTLLRYGFDNCYRIKMTDNLHEIMLDYYGHLYDNKSRIVYFGNSDFNKIDKLDDAKVTSICENLFGNIKGKRVLVLGYNGIPSQNHAAMIDAISGLSQELKEFIHVVLPMTYGASREYIKEIKIRMDALSISYTLLDSFLGMDEVVAIRRTADIVVNIQKSDAISGSLQDHLYCGNVCILGEWLNYKLYNDNGIYYIKTTVNDILTHIEDVIKNYSYYQSLCENNHTKIKNLLSWEATISKQVSVYGE
jgi:hypothetical protein